MKRITQPAPRSGERYIEKMRLMSIAAKMTKYGWLVDRDRIAAHQVTAAERVNKYTEVFLEKSGLPRDALGPAGEGKTGRVREWFFDEMEAPIVARSKKGKPQLNSAALVEWATHDRTSPFAAAAAALYAVRKNRKLIEFCGTYMKFSENDGRIHFEFNPLGTQTGRWTSSTRMRVICEGGKNRDRAYIKEGAAQRIGPPTLIRKKISCNAQQIPKKAVKFDFGAGTEILTSGLRDCFLADPGHVLLRADYDQLELRLIAYVYGVEKLIDALLHKVDIHLLTASSLFRELGITTESNKEDEVVKNAREASKGCAYGMSYQMSIKGKIGRYPTLFKALKERFPSITERQVNRLVERFFELYPEIQKGQQLTKDRIDKYGFVELSVNGRRLYYPPTMRGYNSGLNFPMQGTGGALADRAMIEIDDQIVWEAGQQIRGQVHDEIVGHARYDDAPHVARIISTAMAREAQIGATYTGIPAAADPGLDWGSCMDYEKFVSEHSGLLPIAA